MEVLASCKKSTSRWDRIRDVPGDCDNPLQEMSRNLLYRCACRVAYPLEMWAVELIVSLDSEGLPAAFGQRNMDENAFTLV